MDRPVLNSMLLGSTDVDRLRDWYVAAFGGVPDGYGSLDLGGFTIRIEHRDDVAAKNPEPGRVILNFQVEDAQAVAAHVDELGVTWLLRPERREPGWFGTLVDPDGNYVQIIQFFPAYFAGK